MPEGASCLRLEASINRRQILKPFANRGMNSAGPYTPVYPFEYALTRDTNLVVSGEEEHATRWG